MGSYVLFESNIYMTIFDCMELGLKIDSFSKLLIAVPS